ncbi:MAG TPA: ATP-binding cassette domain-containing protein [Acidimicrobiia bacterium]|nr:ATP-binding cassette domain-containing protein [Acidimicrobiia bacterium]
MTPAIVTEGLERRFGSTEAVAGVDLEVASGEIYGFRGPNGAGKSTTVRMLCTLLTPSAGHARVAGFDVVDDVHELRLHIGVALQDAALDPMQSGVELLRLQGRLYGLSHADVERRIEELAELVDIGPALADRIKTYSGGMQRRLDLAAALIHNPEVLFLDEPTTGLDPASRARVWDEVRKLNDRGITIFLTTQYLEEADALAGRVGIIDHGRIIAEGAPADLKRSLGSDVIVAEVVGDTEAAQTTLAGLEAVERVERHADELTVVTPNAAAMLSPVAVALESCGVTVRSLTMRTPTLDDVFLELTGAHLVPGDAADESE